MTDVTDAEIAAIRNWPDLTFIDVRLLCAIDERDRRLRAAEAALEEIHEVAFFTDNPHSRVIRIRTMARNALAALRGTVDATDGPREDGTS